MMMFAPKITSVFASRWKALGWAAAIMLSAYGIADSLRTAPVAAGASSSGDPAALASLLAPAPPAAPQRSPWAADPATPPVPDSAQP